MRPKAFTTFTMGDSDEIIDIKWYSAHIEMADERGSQEVARRTDAEDTKVAYFSDYHGRNGS